MTTTRRTIRVDMLVGPIETIYSARAWFGWFLAATLVVWSVLPLWWSLSVALVNAVLAAATWRKARRARSQLMVLLDPEGAARA